MSVKYELLQFPGKQTESIYQKVLESFRQHRVPPTAINFAVWYAYHSGKLPDLEDELNAILKDEFGYLDRYGKMLFDKYLLQEDNSLLELDRAIRNLISMLASKIDKLANRLKAQTDTLESCTQQLSQKLSSEELSEITETILGTARSLRDDTALFEQHILQSAQEIQKLRQELMEARQASMKDELTGLLNRRAFNQTIAEWTLSMEDSPESLHLIMTDIDHFKHFNDEFGHLTGDSVLRYFARLMQTTQRKNEMIFRFGGEEFAIMTRDESLEETQARAEALRQKLMEARLKRKTDGRLLGTITASFGIGEFHGPQDDVEQLIARADEALYLAKERGRNQVCTEYDLPASTSSAGQSDQNVNGESSSAPHDVADAS